MIFGSDNNFSLRDAIGNEAYKQIIAKDTPFAKNFPSKMNFKQATELARQIITGVGEGAVKLTAEQKKQYLDHYKQKAREVKDKGNVREAEALLNQLTPPPKPPKPAKAATIVCELSQGRLDETFGPNACAAICYYAAKQFLQGDGIKSENEIVQLMQKGIDDCKSKGQSGKIDFIEEFLQNDASLESIFPEGTPEDFKALNMPIPLTGESMAQLDAHLKTIEKQCRQEKAAAIFTCNGETMMITFPKVEQIQLFDSHSRLGQGASLRLFKEMGELSAHMKTNMFKGIKDERFQILMLKSK